MIKEYSLSLISLLKGVVYDHQKNAWANLVDYEADVKKYFSNIGLDLFIDKSEGYAFLRQTEFEVEVDIPKLAEKRQLDFYTSLLCLVLRKYLLEIDAQGGTVRAIIPQQEIVNRVKLFMPSAPDEAKQQDKIMTTINKVIDIGFLRKVEDNTDNFEIHRIIKGFVNADEIDAALKRLQSYAAEKKSVE
ncbi:MAG TPA: DUF4194 domain-containing protein [Chitinophagaceae bacterium]|jgi:hypothetical protein|nr:DUF4194 domain-containing protein [Chitinophagaceae bacterium]